MSCSVPECNAPIESKDLCHEHYHQQYRDRHRERINTSRKIYRQKNPQKVADSQRKRKYELFYNLRVDEYDTMREFQRQDPEYKLLLGKTGRMRDSIEHRHSDGLVRGVMAPILNRAYGLIERLYPDNTAAVLRALARFHDEPPAIKALGEKVYGIVGRAVRKRKPLYGPDLSPAPPPRRTGGAVEV